MEIANGVRLLMPIDPLQELQIVLSNGAFDINRERVPAFMRPVGCGLVSAFPVDHLGAIAVLWKLLWVW